MTASLLEINPRTYSDVLNVKAVAEKPSASHSADSTRYVTFFFGDALYCVAADEVAEVAHTLPVSPLPHGPEFLSGISPLRGEIVAVIDVGRMLGRSTVASSARSKCVVLRKSETETQPAFKVDRMHELVTLGNANLTVHPQAGSIILGTAEFGSRTVKVISPTTIRAALNS